jgi:hypothetical protein
LLLPLRCWPFPCQVRIMRPPSTNKMHAVSPFGLVMQTNQASRSHTS